MQLHLIRTTTPLRRVIQPLVDNYHNPDLSIKVERSKSQELKKLLANTNNIHKNNIQLTIVELSDSLEELKNSPNVGPAEKRKIAYVEDKFCKLSYQIVDITDIREFANHRPGDRTPLNCTECA
jgi:CRISPR/Cas system-associated endonuclease Cas1